jgi:hypothetical protein
MLACRRSRHCWQTAPLGKPNSNAVKFFSAVELIAPLADCEWRDEATKTIGQFWKRNHKREHDRKKTNMIPTGR